MNVPPWLGGSAVERPRTPIAGELAGDSVLAPVIDTDRRVVTDQLAVSTALARSADASLLVLDLASPSGRGSRVARREVVDGDEEALVEWVTSTDDGPAVPRTPISRGLDVVRTVLEAVREGDVDTVVLPGSSSRGVLRRDTVVGIAVHADCDIVVANGRPGLDTVASVLLPVAGGPHSGLATDVAGGVAADRDACVDVFHVLEPDPSARQRAAAESYIEAARERLRGVECVDTWTVEADDVVGTIIEQSRYYDLTVIGAPTKNRLEQFVFGSTSRAIRSEARSPVVMARNDRRSSEPAAGLEHKPGSASVAEAGAGSGPGR